MDRFRENRKKGSARKQIDNDTGTGTDAHTEVTLRLGVFMIDQEFRPAPAFIRPFGFTLLLAAVLALSSCLGPATGTDQKAALWKVKGRTNTVYLLGSIHVLPRSAYPLNRKLQAAFDDSQRLVFEINLRTLTPGNLHHEFQRTGFYPPGDRLSRHLSPEAQRFLKHILPALGTSFDRVQQFRPWFLAEVLSARYLQMLGYRDDLGVDVYFYRQALARGKPVLGLETLRDQAGIFSSLDEQHDEQYLIDTLVSLPAYSQRVGALVFAWQHGQVGELDRLLNQNEENDPTSFRILFAQRNQKWLPEIERFAQANENYLVIVGAGHLVGNQGVVEALKRAGYDVKQL